MTDKEFRKKIRDDILLILSGLPWLAIGIAIVTHLGFLGFLAILIGIFFCYSGFACISHDIEARQEAKERAEQEAIEKENRDRHIAEVTALVKAGQWQFPAEAFYNACKEAHVTSLNNEFSITKATQIAEKVIHEADEEIPLECCGGYLKKERLEAFLKEGEALANGTELRRIEELKQPRDAEPTREQQLFLERATELAPLTGKDKRLKMLRNLMADYDARLEAIAAFRSIAQKYAALTLMEQKNEESWGTAGGIAQAIAGPAAGLAAASSVMERNREIRAYNASVRDSAMEIMSGSFRHSGEEREIREAHNIAYAKRQEAETKITLSSVTAEELWQNIRVESSSFKRRNSGCLQVSLPIRLKTPLQLDLPEGVYAVVDGTIRGEVWFEDKLVGAVFFPLPMYGMLSNNTETVTLDGMCSRYVEYDGAHAYSPYPDIQERVGGNYTVKLADTQNLWVMEA